MTERERIHRILDELRLTPGRYVVSGSAVMVLHGLPRARPMGDLDLFVATREWFGLQREGGWGVYTTDPDDPKRRVDPPYLFREMHGLEVDVFFDWRRRNVGDIDVAFWMVNAEEVDGRPCVPLQLLLDWKLAMGRAKDLDDIHSLRGALGVPQGVE